jgi:peptide-methionine (S)-S-oxide reductase
MKTDLKVFILLAMAINLFGLSQSEADTEKAVFAGGCFWCMEPPFDKTDGVLKTTSGYAGGNKTDAVYETVSSGTTAHRESVEVEFDPKKVSYEALLEVFWKNVDPFDSSGQFCDKGTQYTSAIFAQTPTQKLAAEKSLKEKSDFFKKPLATKILPAAVFYAAEEYHQDYYKKNPIRYKYYRGRCGRDNRLVEVWGEKK